MKPLDIPTARAIAARLVAARGAILIPSTDPRRTALVYALGAVHALSGSGWDVAAARERVTVTLPAVGTPLAALLALIPGVGGLLADVARTQDRTAIYLSPAAESDPVVLLATIAHELGHVDQIHTGGLAWCAAYGLVPEVRAGAEAPCYGQDVAVLWPLSLAQTIYTSPAILCDQARASLAGYGLDAESMALASGILDVTQRTLEHGGELPGPCADVLAALRAEGCL